MAVPDYQALMRPVLAAYSDGEEHHVKRIDLDYFAEDDVPASEAPTDPSTEAASSEPAVA